MKTQFTPIAMRCTEEQFNAVKPKLENCQLKDISDWNQDNYLVNDYLDIEKLITNLSEKIVKTEYNRIYETWDEKTFLEACGIEVEETFTITKSRILEISKKNTVSQIVMKKVFPEAFDEEVSEALEKEALKRGFKLGVFIKRNFDNLPSLFIKECVYNSDFTYNKYEDILFFNDYIIYSKGKWAEIIPTKTIEEAEKELNCKIIS